MLLFKKIGNKSDLIEDRAVDVELASEYAGKNKTLRLNKTFYFSKNYIDESLY